MSRNRFIRNRIRRGNAEPADIEITSLLDILVILLFFLIQNFNVSNVAFTISKDVQLPMGETGTVNHMAINVQVSPSTVWVDDKIVLESETLSDTAKVKGLYDESGMRINPLYDELVRKKEAINILAQTVPNAEEFSGIVNVIADKSLKFSFLRKVLHTCAEAGYQKYNFVIRRLEN